MPVDFQQIDPLYRRVLRRFVTPLLLLVLVFAVGTAGFYVIGEGRTSLVDCFYFVFISVATIGYGEVIDLTGKPGARIFLMAVTTAGIAVFTYMLSVMTAFIIEGELNQVFRSRRMKQRIDELSAHYILCGVGRVGSNIAHELAVTGRPFMAIDTSADALALFRERFPETPWLHGDSSDDAMLLRAGIERAAGVFAVTGEDAKNLVIALTAKQLRPAVRVVARCHELNYMPKMERVGADAIVSPDFTGGMRIVSSMVRPHVVTFLDEMLRSDNHMRVEEIQIRAGFSGGTLGRRVPPARDHIVLALRRGQAWDFNPPPDTELAAGEVLVLMATPDARQRVEQLLAG
ncbi:MAG TPA: potassium channel protein [Usitatibacteraceae bacterium]|nr:potassium channel protein [Usitatibacteraceae bacterium]